MNEERLSRKNLGWCLPGRRRRRRRRRTIRRNLNSWMQEIKTGMREKGIDNMEWIDREKWRR